MSVPWCWRVLPLAVLLSATGWAGAQDDLPKSLDPRLRIELFADAPQIVTPTGIDVDHHGRVWAVESNTHFRPDDYQGHPSDRVLVMEDADHDGKADKTTVFKDGLTFTMSVAVKPVWLDFARNDADMNSGLKPPVSKGHSAKASVEVYIATRQEILLCRDTDGDLKCDDVRRIVHLDTTGNYPHNGLAGFAFDAFGNLYFGFGENLGADYKVIGSDRITLSGGGEGGSVYRCRPDGTRLERWATGFWNPHASCIDGLGRMFTLDNDPDSRPPCRLLHIVQQGDYGYRFRNGRKGTHPFTAWNGEIPGTLPMVSGTGEAPSGIVSYEANGFPDDYFGTLLVGSWGDHRIDKFVLRPRGISFESFPQPIITGGENFRPVGLALAPDGSLYVTDWVLKEYKLHGRGRIWRVSAANKSHGPATSDHVDLAKQSVLDLVKSLDSRSLTTRRLAAKILAGTNDGRMALDRIRREPALDSRSHFEAARAGVAYVEPAFYLDLSKIDLNDPFVLSNLVNHIADMFARMINVVARPSMTQDSLKQLVVEIEKLDPSVVERQPHERERCEIAMLLALRKKFPKESSLVQHGLRSITPASRRLAVQWIGEERLGELRPDVERVLASEPMTADLFMACMASLSLLDGTLPNEFEKTLPVKYILPMVTDSTKPPTLRAMALRMLPASQKELDGKLLNEMLTSAEPVLRREAVRTLQRSQITERDPLLRGIAADEALDVNLRADAVAGLAAADHSAMPEPTRQMLLKLASGDRSLEIRLEAIRSLRGPVVAARDHAPGNAAIVESLDRIASSDALNNGAARPAISEAVAFALGRQPKLISSELLHEFSAAGFERETPTEHQALVEEGRRTFFHQNGAGCYKCHMVSGRGGQIGPDLTVIARTMNRKKLAESILEPSKEIAPQFTTWAVETKSGKTLTGMLMGEEVNGDLRLANQQGQIMQGPFKEIEIRTPMKTSIMPDKLQDAMTPRELRSLIVFLETLK